MIVLALVLAIVVLVLAGVLVHERRQRTQERTTQDRLQTLVDELRGQLDTLTREKDLRRNDVEKERDAYRTLTTEWKTIIDRMESSLRSIDTQATGTVKGLSDVLRPVVTMFRTPQAAGIEFGESELELILRQHLGEGLYVRKPAHLAYGQDVVDFAITLPGCTIPIDSKFPSASYSVWVEAAPEDAPRAWRTFRDQLLTQLEQTRKYIRPEAGTTDYALLFVPSDVIYQQAFLTQKVYDQENPLPNRSRELQVFGCSPLTLLPYIGLIRLGLRNFKIADDVKGIREQIEQLGTVFRAFDDDWRTLRTHTRNLAQHVERLEGGRGSKTKLQEAVERLSSVRQETSSDSTGAAQASQELEVGTHD